MFNLQEAPFVAREEALQCWPRGHDNPPPPDSLLHCQKEWDSPRVKAVSQALLCPRQQTPSLLPGCWQEGIWRLDECTFSVISGIADGWWDYLFCWGFETRNSALLSSWMQSTVDNLVTHGLSCCWSEGRHQLHTAVNNITQRALTSAKIPSWLEPAGLYRTDGKRPDGCSIISGKALVWDATCPDTFTPSHVSKAAREAGAVALQAEQLKRTKYTALESSHHFGH